MAYQDIPIIDSDVLEAQIIEPDELTRPQGKPRPAPPRPKQKIKKKPRQPIVPIKVTPEMRESMMATIDSEMAQRLIAEQGEQSDEQRKLDTLSVFGQGGIAGMALERTIGEGREDLKLRMADTARKTKEVVKSTKGRAVRRAAEGKRITPFEQQLIQIPDEMQMPEMPDTSIKPSGRFTSDIAAFLQPIAQMGPMTVEGVVELMDFMGNIGQSEAEAKAGAMAPGVKKYTGTASSFLRGALPADEKYPETNLLGGLGSAAGFAGAGLTAKAVRIPSFVSTAIIGAGINIADVLREADRMGIDPKRRDASLVLAAATGLTEMIGLGKTIETFGLSKAFSRRLFEIAEEGGQEGLQQWLNNINAAVVGQYDPNRPLTKDLLESLILGAAVGGVAQAGSYAKQKLFAPNPQKDLPPVRPWVADKVANIPPPPGYTPPAPVGRALPSSGPMVPMADMGLMAEKGIPQEVVADSSDREDNLLEFLRHSQGFTKSGDPIVGYHPSIAPTEHDVMQFTPAAEGYGSGWILYQDPELASGLTKKGYTTMQDHLDHPEFERLKQEEMVSRELKMRQEWEAENPGKPFPEWKNKWIEYDAQVWAEGEVKKLLEDKPSPNLRPYYFDIRKPFDIDQMYGADVIADIRTALTRHFDDLRTFRPGDADSRIEEFLRIQEEEIKDGVEPGVTGKEIYKAIDETIRTSPKVDLGFDYHSNPGAVNKILERAGYDGLTFLKTEDNMGNPLPPKEFNTLEEAQAYADKVGGRLEPFAGATLVPEITDPGDPRWGIQPKTTPAVVSQGPAVVGTRAWMAWKGTQLKSATGNTGQYSPEDPSVLRAEAEATTGTALAPVKEPQTFEVIPPLGGATDNAPFMMLPRWAMKAIGANTARGINIPLTKLGTSLKQIRKAAPTPEQADEATKALYELADQSIDQGLNSLSLVAQDQADEVIRQTAQHETFHAAMRAGLLPKKNWVMNHPLLRKIINRPIVIETSTGETLTLPSVRELFFSNLSENDAIVALALEIGPYTVEGKVRTLGLSPAEGIDFLFDIYNHMRTEYGPEGMAKFKSLTRLRPAMTEALDLAESMWDTHAMEMAMPEDSGFRWDDDVVASLPEDYRAEDDPSSGFGRKVKNWFSTKLGRRTIEDNPPEPNIPDETEDITPPPPGPPPPGRGPGGGAEGPLGPLFKNHVTPEYNQLLVRTFRRMLEEGGIAVDPTMGPPFHQVVAALRSGELRNVDIDAILEDEGIVWDEFSRLMEETASDAGKVLQSYSEIAKFWNEIIDEYEISEGIEKPRGGKAGPRLPGEDYKAFLRLVPIEFRIRRALKGVHSTALGKNWWQRAGNRTQKAMLTQLSTFAVNSMTSTGQLPIRVATQGIGGWLQQMIEEKGSFRQRLHRGNQEMIDSMEAGLEVLFSMNPWQLAQWAKYGANSTRFMQHQQTIHQLEKVFPDIKKKLFALSSGTETLKIGKRQLSVAKALIPQVKDRAKREQLLKDIEGYERRLEANTKGIGKVMNGVELVYDFHLWPMQWAEYFLRRPMFVAQLTMELKREGKDLQFLLTNNMMDQISPETMERAVNRALEFTYAYMPGTKTGTNYKTEKIVEKAAMGLIEWLNKNGGPLNAFIGEPFAKAAFNGAKFVYEYSPVGGILPFGRVARNLHLRPTIADVNSQLRMGTLPSNTKVNIKGTIQDPVTNKVSLINPTNREDYDRLAKAMVGTFMYATVGFLRYAIGGPEWWQLDLGEEDEKGEKVYTDIRRLKPVSTLFQLYDLAERVATGRLGDIDVLKVLTEVMTGIRIYDNQMGGSIMESAADWFRNEPPKTAGLKMDEDVGKALAVYITPFLNIRDCIAQFVEEENVKKDVRGEGIVGPVMDRIPFLRQRLPDLTSPTQPGPIKLSLNPGLAQLSGYKETPAENFAGEEWARMGLYNKNFLERMADPVSNRAQNEFFQEVIGEIGKELEKDPEYQAMDDLGKGALWERLAEGIAAKARKIGKAANPVEAAKEKVREKVPGRLRRKQMGLEEELENIK